MGAILTQCPLTFRLVGYHKVRSYANDSTYRDYTIPAKKALAYTQSVHTNTLMDVDMNNWLQYSVQ